MAIKKKTKAQKDQDVQHLERLQQQLLKAVDSFKTELYEAELNIEYVNIGPVLNMFRYIDKIRWSKSRIKQTHTRINVYDDQDNVNYHNATDLEHYE
jgi:hypothetical protein